MNIKDWFANVCYRIASALDSTEFGGHCDDIERSWNNQVCDLSGDVSALRSELDRLKSQQSVDRGLFHAISLRETIHGLYVRGESNKAKACRYCEQMGNLYIVHDSDCQWPQIQEWEGLIRMDSKGLKTRMDK